LSGTPFALAALLLLAPAAGAEEEAAGATPAAERAAARFGLSLASDQKMSIRAEELEAVRGEAGAERVLFRRGVRATQGDLAIACDELEARYGKAEDGGPDQITARGEVRIRQKEVEVLCAEAVFQRLEQWAVCRGGSSEAVLRRGDDVVRGREIRFDLARGVLSVKGGARVTVEPGAAGAP
jgi:lipopolysaccharide export system protein LptA